MGFTEIEGPYSFKGADGLKTPVYIFLPGGERYDIGEATVKVDGGMTFDIQLNEGHENAEYGAFDVPMRFSGHNRKSEAKINWGYNCLTAGIHHGRPEPLWNLPLLQASIIFTQDGLKEIVVNRIYNDALMYVENPSGITGNQVRWTQVWANQIKEYAENWFLSVFERKLDELHAYYASTSWQRDVEGVVERIRDNRLNPSYQPLHSHDSVNMLCRIIGVSASQEASREFSET